MNYLDKLRRIIATYCDMDRDTPHSRCVELAKCVWDPALNRVLVKRVLRKFGYPPDMQQRATELVLEQAEVLCKDWSS